MFMDEADLLDLDKEINEAAEGGKASSSRSGGKGDEAKGSVTGAGSFGRHAATSGPPPPSSARPSISSPVGTSRGKIKAPAGPPPSTLRPSTAEFKADSTEDANLGSTMSGSSSRARILAQQRELMMKRRQEGMKAGMVRSVDSPNRPALDAQHTPAIRQFSAPRTVNDDPYSSFGSSGKLAREEGGEVGSSGRPSTRGGDLDRDGTGVAGGGGGGGEEYPSGSSVRGGPARQSSDSDYGRRGGGSSPYDGPPGRPGSRERDLPPGEDDYADYREYDRPRSAQSRPSTGGRGRPPPPDGPPGSARRPGRDYDYDEYGGREPPSRSRMERGGGDREDGGGYYGSRDERGGYGRGDRDREYNDRDYYERGPDRDRDGGYGYGDYDDRDRRGPPRGGYRDSFRDRGGYDDRDEPPRDPYERDRRRPPRDDADRDRDYDRDYGGSGRSGSHGGPRGGVDRAGGGAPGGRGPVSPPTGSERGVDRDRRQEEDGDYERAPASTNYRGGGPTSPPSDVDRRGSAGSHGTKGSRGREEAAAAAPPKDDGAGDEGDQEEEDDDEESEADEKDLAQAAPKPAATGAGARDDASAKNASPSLDFLDLATGDNLQRFLNNPCPKKAGVVQCHIRRRKGGAGKLYPEYYLYLKQGDRFLLAGRKRPNNKTSNYMITRSESDFNRDSDKYLGKLRANFVGTEFQVFDNGSNPKDEDEKRSGGKTRGELGVVLYASNVLGSRGPRKMQVCIPQVRPEDDTVVSWRESKDRVRDDELLEKMRRGDTSKLHYFINKPPRWNDQVGAYVLNFNGRVTMASVKNFQLIDPEDQEAIILQFGRVGKDEFTMDFQWPISPFQAFAVTLSSFDSKIACD